MGYLHLCAINQIILQIHTLSMFKFNLNHLSFSFLFFTAVSSAGVLCGNGSYNKYKIIPNRFHIINIHCIQPATKTVCKSVRSKKIGRRFKIYQISNLYINITPDIPTQYCKNNQGSFLYEALNFNIKCIKRGRFIKINLSLLHCI